MDKTTAGSQINHISTIPHYNTTRIIFMRSAMNILGEFLGYLAGICTAIVFLPQTIQTIKDRNVSGLSLSTYIIYCVGMVSWILYGVYLHSVQMMFFNGISLFFAAIILYMIVTQKMKQR